MKLFTVFFILMATAITSYAQSPEKLLELGRNSYRYDRLDSASFYYNKAFQQTDGNIQLEAITGLTKIALLRADLNAADSLIKIGEGLSNSNLKRKSVYPFEITKGVYLKKNSEFQKALVVHKKVVAESANWEDGIVIYADALFQTALTLERVAEYDSSITYIEKAYKIYQQNLDTTSIKFASIYNGLGVCYYRANDFQKSKMFYLKSKQVCETHFGPISSDLALCLSNLSSISRIEENYHEAIDYSEAALQIFRALDDQEGISGAFYSLGVYYYFLGDYGRTKEYMEACIALRKELYNANHYALINPYEVLGIALEESGDYDQTLYYLKKVKPIIIANFGAGSLQDGLNSENTSICFKNINQQDSALHYILYANKILTKHLDKNAYQLATHHVNLSSALFNNGFNERAKASALTAGKIYENLGMSTSSEYAQNLALLAQITIEEENWEKGDQYFEHALSLIKATEKDSAMIMLPDNLAVLNEYIGYIYNKYKTQQRNELLDTFHTYSNKYLSITENLRKQFNDPYTKSILIKDNAQLYNKAIGIYNQLYATTKDEAHLVSAYNFSEYGRTALLRDMQDEKIKYFAGVPDTIIQKEKVLKQRISELNQQLIEDPTSTDNKRLLFESKEALNKHIENLSVQFPKYHALKFNTKLLSIEAIQAKLTQGQNLVEYMQDDTAYYALYINETQRDLTYLGNKNKVDQYIKEWKDGLITQDENKTRINGHQLYKLLWKPIEQLIKGEKIIAIPVGPIFYVNLETLSKKPEVDDFLIYNYNISYALSFNTYFLADNTTSKNNIISIAPGFEEEIKQAYKQKVDSLETLDQAFMETVRQPWAVNLAKKLNSKFNNTTFIGIQANESNIKANISEAGLLYFGTHAITNAVDPLRSKLVLAKEVDEQKEDGYLHAYELFGLELNAELAVLNACESGLGAFKKGEGMISLAYSMQYAGCPSTIMSLWKVDEKINTKITSDFFENLAKGFTKSEALRAAKLDYLATTKGSLASPFFWGGMVLMGKDNTMKIEENYKIRYIVLVFAILAIIIGYFLYRKKYKQKGE